MLPLRISKAYPVETPVSTPTPEDLQEPTTKSLIAEGVYLQLVIAPWKPSGSLGYNFFASVSILLWLASLWKIFQVVKILISACSSLVYL